MIDTDGTMDTLAPMTAQCYMNTDGGGWTLIGNMVASGTTPNSSVVRTTLPMMNSPTVGGNENGNALYWGIAPSSILTPIQSISTQSRELFKYSGSVISYKWNNTTLEAFFSTATPLTVNTVTGMGNYSARFSPSLGWGPTLVDGCCGGGWPTFGVFNSPLYWSGVSQRSSIRNQGFK